MSLVGVGAGAGAAAGAGDLDALVLSGAERFEAALAAGGTAAAAEMALRIETARRDTSNRYRAWASLTEAYLFDAGGHDGRVVAARLERTAELALRSGFDLDSLTLADNVSAGPVNPLSEAISAATARGDREALRDAFDRGDDLLRRIHDFRCDLLSDQLGAIYRRGGPEELEAAMLFAAHRGPWKTSIPADLALEPSRRIRELAFFLTVCAHFRIKIIDEGARWRIDVLEVRPLRAPVPGPLHRSRLGARGGPRARSAHLRPPADDDLPDPHGGHPPPVRDRRVRHAVAGLRLSRLP